MPRCKNIPEGEKACYYTGDEPSPRGRGYAAKFCEGDSKKGTDGRMYLAKGGRWILKTPKRNSSPRGTGYNPIVMNIKNICNLKNIKCPPHDINEIAGYDVQKQGRILWYMKTVHPPYEHIYPYMENASL